VPAARHSAAEGVYPALWVDNGGIGVGKNHTARADGGKGLAFLNNACTNSCGCIISSAAGDNAVHGKAGSLSKFRGDMSGDFRRFKDLGQKIFVNVELFQDFL
jgi:hypothetical protein